MGLSGSKSKKSDVNVNHGERVVNMVELLMLVNHLSTHSRRTRTRRGNSILAWTSRIERYDAKFSSLYLYTSYGNTHTHINRRKTCLMQCSNNRIWRRSSKSKAERTESIEIWIESV